MDEFQQQNPTKKIENRVLKGPVIIFKEHLLSIDTIKLWDISYKL